MADTTEYNLGKLNVIVDATTKPFSDAIKKVKEEAESLTQSANSNKAMPGIDLSGIISQLESIKAEIKSITELIKTKVSDATNSVVDGGKQVVDTTKVVNDEMDKTVDKIDKQGTTANKTAKKTNNYVKSIKNVISGLAKVGTTGVKGFTKVTAAIGSGLKKLIPFQGAVKKLINTTKMMLAFGIVMRGLETIGDYVSNAVSKNTQLSASLAQLKGNMLTAIQPIYEAILPALQALIDGLVTVSGYIAQFTASIFGTSVKASQANAKAMNEQANATDKVAKATKEANKQLGKYDELNVINKSSSSSSSPSSSGSESGIAATFEPIEEHSLVDKIIAKIKDAWEDGDFTEIGQTVGNKLNEALEAIPWDNIKTTASKIAESIATFLNGFIEATDWTLVGKTFAEGINTIIDTAYTFVTTFEWKLFGESIGQAVNGFFDNVDWVKLGKTLSDGIIGIVDSITTFISEIDWEGIGEDVGDFLCSIDWIEILNRLLDLIITTAIALADFVIGIGKTIGGNIVDGIKNCFESSELGKSLKGAINNVKTFFTKKLPGFTMSIKGKVDSTFTKVKKAFNNLKNNAIVKTIKGKTAKAFTAVKKAFNNLKSNGITKTIKGKTSSAFTKVKDAWNGIKSKAISLTTKLPSTKSVTEGMKNLFKTAANAVIDIFNGLVDKLNEIMKFTVPSTTILGKKIGGGSYTLMSLPNIKPLATGGVLRKGQTGYLEGDGDEAVVPLEQNTGWIDKLAVKLSEMMSGGNSSVQMAGADYIVLNVDGNQMIKFFRNANGEYKKQTGRNITD